VNLVTATLTQPAVLPVGENADKTSGPWSSFDLPPEDLAGSNDKLYKETINSMTGLGENMETVGSSDLLGTLNNGLSLMLKNLSLQVTNNPLVNAVLNTVLGVVGNLDALLTPIFGTLDTTLQSVFDVLGLQVGEATTEVQGVLVGQPEIVTTTGPAKAGS
jgi:uncharacterized membrane protein